MADEKKNTRNERIAEARRRAEEAKREREDKAGKLTAKDDLISVAGNLLASDKQANESWEKFFDGPIAAIERHVKSVDQYKMQNRDQYARVLVTFDQCDDYSSDDWEISLEQHREHLAFLKELRDEFKEDWKDEPSGSDNDSNPSDGSDSSVGGGVRGGSEERKDDGGAGESQEAPCAT